MSVQKLKFITRDMLRAQPDVLFVFGDNLIREGYGGQAREMRGEPNAVGIPTKKYPSNQPIAFFRDIDFDTWLAASKSDFERLEKHADKGGTIVMPEDGIGTGLAQLPERAPRIWQALCVRLAGLEGRR